MKEAKPKVQFYSENFTVRNALSVEQCGTQARGEAFTVTPALISPTPAGSAIESLTITRKASSATTTTCAITANDELLRALRAIPQQNSRHPQEISKVFVKEVNPLLDLHRGLAQQARGPCFGAEQVRPLPPAAQASHERRCAEVSLSSYTRAAEGNEPIVAEDDWLRCTQMWHASNQLRVDLDRVLSGWSRSSINYAKHTE